MILKFSKKILIKEWRKLLLPFLSVLLTGAVISTSYFLVGSARDFLELKNKEFLGGDVVFESSNEFALDSILENEYINKSSKQIEFNAILSKDIESSKTTGVHMHMVDRYFPLYGRYILKYGEYKHPNKDEIYIASSVAKTFEIDKGDVLFFNNTPFTVSDIILEDPESLFAGFNFLGKVILNTEAKDYASLDLELFRKDFIAKVLLNKNLSVEEKDKIRDLARSYGVRTRFETSSNSGLSFGLEIVERFLVVAVLIISILALVNIYASVNYLAKRLRRSFAILISIGMNIKNIYKILFLVNFFIISIATFLGLICGYYLTLLVTDYVKINFELDLALNVNTLEMIVVFASVVLTSIFATVPVLNRMRKITPKELLSHGSASENKNAKRSVVFDVLVGILPITLFAMYFLDSLIDGFLVVCMIVLIYGAVMLFYYYFIDFLYRRKKKFAFPVQMIIAQKKFDGFFGMIAFASLFVALIAVFNLSIVRSSIESYLKEDLKRTLPSIYVLDIQKSQKDGLTENFTEINLFPNVRARITNIDDVDIQGELAKLKPRIDRELGREFNLTYRDYLLPSEKVEKGSFSDSTKGWVSVEKEFAERANIKMGSKIKFLIQGFEIESTVRSIREVDTRSGYPFFYFILPPSDLSNFPTTYFGYANIGEERSAELSKYLAKEAPNASVINTGSITKLAETLINFLIIIILIITIPPLALSSLLIVTILATLSKERKRDGARLMALGKTMHFVRNYYIVESLSTTVVASVFAYILSLVISNFLILNYLKIDSLVYFEIISMYIFAFILVGLVVVSIMTWQGGKKSLREYLNYEENN